MYGELKQMKTTKDKDMKRIKNAAKFAIHHIMSFFGGGSLGVYTLIGTLEVIAQTWLRYLDNDWELSSMWHVIFWSLWLYTCIVVRVVRKPNYS